MASLENILRDINLFVDGKGQAGNIDQFNLPKLKIKEEMFRGGAMDAEVAVDMGMEKLEADWTLTSFDPAVLTLYGLAPGNTTQVSMRGALRSEVDGSVKAAVCTLGGTVREIDPGSWQPGKKATCKCRISATYYKLEVEGRVVHEIDVLNYRRIINGTDVLATTRAALGV